MTNDMPNLPRFSTHFVQQNYEAMRDAGKVQNNSGTLEKAAKIESTMSWHSEDKCDHL